MFNEATTQQLHFKSHTTPCLSFVLLTLFAIPDKAERKYKRTKVTK